MNTDYKTIIITMYCIIDVNSYFHFSYTYCQAYTGSDCPIFGCFSAASNITGTLVPVDEVTALVHAHGGFVFWDYATAAPYVNIDMNPVSKNR